MDVFVFIPSVARMNITEGADLSPGYVFVLKEGDLIPSSVGGGGGVPAHHSGRR